MEEFYDNIHDLELRVIAGNIPLKDDLETIVAMCYRYDDTPTELSRRIGTILSRAGAAIIKAVGDSIVKAFTEQEEYHTFK